MNPGGHDDSSSDLIVGRNPVIEAIKSGRQIDKLIVSEGRIEGSLRRILAMAEKAHILVQKADKSVLDRISGNAAHQGVVARVSPYRYSTIDEILRTAAERDEPAFIVILDQIEDPGNLGSLIRSAETAGAHGVIITKHRSASLTTTVAKASAGALEHIKVARSGNLASDMRYLKEKGVWLVGLEADSKQLIYDFDFSVPVGLVVGSEGRGLRRLTKETCDEVVKLPIRGRISSLNAAVAGAIAMYELVRQRYVSHESRISPRGKLELR